MQQTMSSEDNTEKERRMALSEGVVKVCQYANNFFTGTLHKKCCPFIIAGKKVGLVPPNIIAVAKKYPDLFEVKLDKATDQVNSVHISRSLTTNEERSAKMAEVLAEWRRQDLFVSLKGWRDELYSVWHDFSEPPLMKMERTATSLFGVKQYGVHINGYVHTEDKGLCMWIGKRSPTKQTWPNMYDQIAAGGLSTGLGIMECARKEAQEEASIPDDLLDKLKHTGTVSYFYEDERGVFPECQFVLDLELPADFTPVNADGEVASFQLLPVDQIKQMIADGKFKFNCGLVCLDFFIRHGYITPDNEPKYTYLVENMHKTLP